MGTVFVEPRSAAGLEQGPNYFRLVAQHPLAIVLSKLFHSGSGKCVLCADRRMCKVSEQKIGPMFKVVTELIQLFGFR